jgi:glycosyltransferase involved in cell wall biosynthesis
LIKGMVSIVIPIVRNDPHVDEAVEAIKKSTYTNYEIIIVNEGKERSYQRNFGIKKAKGEYLIWLDSDMVVAPDMLADCVKIIETPCKDYLGFKEYPVGIFIPERIVTKGWFGKLRDWERQFYTGTLVDVVRFLRTKDCPLFDETLHGVEDSSWERQLPKGPRAISTSHFDHHDKVGVIKYLKKKWYYAACLSAYKKKNPDDKLLTFRYRCWKVYTENGKWKRLFSRPDLAIQVFILLFARGVIARIQEIRNP